MRLLRKYKGLYAVFFLLNCIWFCDFGAGKSVSKGGLLLTKISYVTSLPYFDKNGLRNFNDSSCIYYYGNNVIFETRAFNTVEFNDSDTIIYSVVYNYYFTRKGFSQCLLYKQDFTTEPEIQNIDSLLQKGVIRQSVDFSPILAFGRKILDTAFNSDVNFVQYTGVGKSEPEYFDTASFYFDKKMKNVDLSFSKSLDRMYDSKLVKVELVFNEIFSTKFNITIPKRRTKIFMRRETITNKDSILFLIKKSEAYFK